MADPRTIAQTIADYVDSAIHAAEEGEDRPDIEPLVALFGAPRLPAGEHEYIGVDGDCVTCGRRWHEHPPKFPAPAAAGPSPAQEEPPLDRCWECVNCCFRHYNSELELATIRCGCGTSKGRWMVVKLPPAPAPVAPPEPPMEVSCDGCHECPATEPDGLCARCAEEMNRLCPSCKVPFDDGARHVCSSCDEWVCNDCKVDDAGELAPCSGTCKRCRREAPPVPQGREGETYTSSVTSPLAGELLDAARGNAALNRKEGEPDEAEGRRLAARQQEGEPSTAAHVITKGRQGGGRDEPLHYYAVLPQRATEAEALADLKRWEGQQEGEHPEPAPWTRSDGEVTWSPSVADQWDVDGWKVDPPDHHHPAPRQEASGDGGLREAADYLADEAERAVLAAEDDGCSLGYLKLAAAQVRAALDAAPPGEAEPGKHPYAWALRDLLRAARPFVEGREVPTADEVRHLAGVSRKAGKLFDPDELPLAAAPPPAMSEEVRDTLRCLSEAVDRAWTALDRHAERGEAVRLAEAFGYHTRALAALLGPLERKAEGDRPARKAARFAESPHGRIVDDAAEGGEVRP